VVRGGIRRDLPPWRRGVVASVAHLIGRTERGVHPGCPNAQHLVGARRGKFWRGGRLVRR
jgi:hypothetical protein